MKGRLRAVLRAAAEFFFPTVRCLACGEEAELSARGLCPDCGKALAPGRIASSGHGVHAIAPFAYDGPAGALVRGLKFRGIRLCAAPLGEGCAALAAAEKLSFDAVVPVPISARRLRERGFNQSALIARYVAQAAGAPLMPGLLRRVRHTGEQAKLTKEKRMENVAGAFWASGGARGLRVLLVDDVFTTGATCAECISALERVGAAQVIVLCATVSGVISANNSGQPPQN